MSGATIRSYRDLIVWQHAVDLVESVYQATERFPRHEIYGLSAQLRRAAVSVPSNIAEGHGRRGPREYLHHLSIANGSLMEVETQIVIARRLGYLPEELEAALQQQTAEVGRTTAGLIRALKARVKLHP
jgi:four helix bundle protein